jgi:hypothetical protein
VKEVFPFTSTFPIQLLVTDGQLEHEPAPSALQVIPVHSVHVTDPAAAAVPASHDWHSVWAGFGMCPAGQISQPLFAWFIISLSLQVTHFFPSHHWLTTQSTDLQIFTRRQ